MTAGTQPIDQGIAGHARDRRLSGRIHICDDHRAGIVHAGAELVEQRVQARVPVRLHHRDHVARAGLPRRFQHRGDLHRVMAVVVDDRDTASLAGLGEAPLHAGEPRERTAQRVVVDFHLDTDRHRRQRILHVVSAEHRQPERPQLARTVARAIGDRDVEGRAQLVRHHAVGAHIGLRREPVGDDATIRQAWDHLLHRRMVDAQHREAIERHIGDELVVAGDHRLGVPQ